MIKKANKENGDCKNSRVISSALRSFTSDQNENQLLFYNEPLLNNHSYFGKTVNFITDNLLLISIAVVSGFALLLPNLQRRGARVSQLQATQYMNQAKTLVLDVRSAEEFASGHLPGAKNIPLDQLSGRVSEIEKSKNNVVITVCQSGVRSANAVSVLNKAGFTQVFSLDGGVAEWKAQSLPTVK